MPSIFPPHGGYLRWARETIGPGDYIDFSANINPFGPSPNVLQAARKALENLADYPDPGYIRLKEVAAQYYGVRPENILPGNGAAEFFYLLAEKLRPRRTLLIDPSFADYRRAARSVRSKVESVTLEPPFVLTEEKECEFVELLERGSVLVLGQPNNPTGRVLPRPVLRRLVEACETAGSLLVLDESFLEFVPGGEELSLAKDVVGTNSLVVVRSLTKIHAIAGLRLGFCIGPARLMERLEGERQSWSVNVVAEAAGIAALNDRLFLQESRRKLRRLGDLCFSRLTAIPGLVVYPSAVNFHLLYAPDSDLVLKLARRGLLVRDCRDFPGLGPGYFRAAVRRDEENRLLCTALAELVSG